MTLSCNDLIGREITSITFIHDYLQVGFSGGFGLTINNKFVWSTLDSASMIGIRLSKMQSEGKNLILHFSDTNTLSVDLSEKGFICPEAILLGSDEQDLPIIWREEDVEQLLNEFAI